MSQLMQNTTDLDILIAKANALPNAGSGETSPSFVNSNDVQYIDYDGAILYSYTAEQFSKLSSEPSLPTRDGLICQGWNWSFSDAQSYVAKYGKLFVGANYITDDGRTRIYITLQKGRLEPYLGFGLNGTCVIYWGDGTSNTVTGTSLSTVKSTKHSYTEPGDYVIELEVTSGSIRLNGNSSYGSTILWKNTTSAYYNRCYQNAIIKVEIGGGVNSIYNYAFFGCYALETISIPNTITNIGGSAFRYSCRLKSIVIPNGITTINDNTFRYACCLSSISIPNTVASIENTVFQYCFDLESVTVPQGITLFSEELFYGCNSLSSVIIPDEVTEIGSNAFYNCYSLATVDVPDSVISIGENAFYGCYCVSSAKVPHGVVTVNKSTYYGCYKVTYINIPSSVAEIGTNAFTCYGVSEIHFGSVTPPVLSGSNSFANIPTDCIIYVPSGSLDAYTSATNYPDPATYTYMEE